MKQEVTEQIFSLCATLKSEAQSIMLLEPVSHLSKGIIRWHGGIIGGIQEHREAKRGIKMMDEPFFEDWTYYSYGVRLFQAAKELVTLQLQIQQAYSPNEDLYYANTRLIVDALISAREAWMHYSPDLYTAVFSFKGGGEGAWGLAIEHEINTKILEMDLPADLKNLIEGQMDNGGCLGVLLLFIILPLSALAVFA